jgi:hypothetical protein
MAHPPAASRAAAATTQRSRTRRLTMRGQWGPWREEGRGAAHPHAALTYPSPLLRALPLSHPPQNGGHDAAREQLGCPLAQNACVPCLPLPHPPCLLVLPAHAVRSPRPPSYSPFAAPADKLDDDSGARVPFKPGLYAISLPGVEVEAAKHLARRGGAGDEEDEYEDDGADDDDESGGEGEAELDDDDMGAGAGAASSSSSAGARRKGGRTGGARAGAGAGAGASSSSSSSSRGAGTVRFEADPEAQQEAVEAALVEPDEDDDE